MFYPYEGYRSVTPLDAARVNRTIFHKHSVHWFYTTHIEGRDSSRHDYYIYIVNKTRIEGGNDRKHMPWCYYCMLISTTRIEGRNYHIVGRYDGARRFFFTDQLNPHLKKRPFYGLPLYYTVRCGALFLFDNPGIYPVLLCFFRYFFRTGLS